MSLSRTIATYTISSNTSNNNLSKQAAQLERDQLVSQYTNQLRNLALQYEQNQIQVQNQQLQNTLQNAGAMNDVMQQRFAANNAYIAALQNINNNQTQNANESSEALRGATNQTNQTNKQVSQALQQGDKKANTTRRGNAEMQNLIDRLASEVQSQLMSNNMTLRDVEQNTDYTNRVSQIMANMATTQRNNDNAAATTTAQLANLTAQQNAANLSRAQQLNSASYQNAASQVNSTINQVQQKYLQDLQNLATLRRGAGSNTVSSSSSTGTRNSGRGSSSTFGRDTDDMYNELLS